VAEVGGALTDSSAAKNEAKSGKEEERPEEGKAVVGYSASEAKSALCSDAECR
jgi:hypothetical protein